MDRRAKKLEKKRKDRALAKSKAAVLAAKRPSPYDRLVRAASRAALGEVFVSAGWDDPEHPALVSVLVTRPLANDEVAVAMALVDRTCLGIKDAHVFERMSPAHVAVLVQRLGAAHDGMEKCEALVAQSIVFHALDYARALGFEPHEDFEPALFGPRPETLLETPWCRHDRPIFLSGPRDDTRAVLARLERAVGAQGFDFEDRLALEDDSEDEEWDSDGGEQAKEPELIVSPLEQTVERDGIALRIGIYRLAHEPDWVLEVEDPFGGSTVWDDRFASEQDALEAALSTIEEDGAESLIVRSSGADRA
jgi:hypothetical protein